MFPTLEEAGLDLLKSMLEYDPAKRISVRGQGNGMARSDEDEEMILVVVVVATTVMIILGMAEQPLSQQRDASLLYYWRFLFGRFECAFATASALLGLKGCRLVGGEGCNEWRAAGSCSGV